MAAMRRFGHGAGIGQHAAGARGCDADGVRELSRIEFQEMSGRDRGAERTDGAGRMKPAGARLELAGGLANPALHLHAFDQRGQNLAAASRREPPPAPARRRAWSTARGWPGSTSARSRARAWRRR